MNPWNIIQLVIKASQEAMKALEEAKQDDGKVDAGEMVKVIWTFAWTIIQGVTSVAPVSETPVKVSRK
jgi:hypothetical protein